MRMHSSLYRGLFLKALFFSYLLIVFPPVLWQTYIGDIDTEIDEENYFLPFSIPIKAAVSLYMLASGFLWSKRLWRNAYLSYLIIFVGLLTPFAESPAEHLSGFANLFLAYSFTLLVAFRLGPDQALKVYFFYNLAILVAGYVGLALGSTSVIQCDFSCATEYYKGFYSGKNALGLAYAITLIILLNFKENIIRGDALRWALIVGIFAGLIYSDSRAPLLALVGCMVFQLVAKSYWNSPRSFMLLLLFLIPMSVLLVVAPHGDLLALLGRDITLSGRVNIWMDVIRSVDFNILYGGGIGSSISIIGSSLLGIYAIDNSWIVMALEMGVASTLAYVLWIAKNIISPFRIHDQNEAIKGAAFFFLLIYGFAEKGAMLSASQVFIFLILVHEWAKGGAQRPGLPLSLER